MKNDIPFKKDGKKSFKEVLKFIFFLLLLLLIASQHVFGQRDSVQSQTYEIIKTFKPVLSEAIKIPVHPNPEVPEIAAPEFKYTYAPKQYKANPTLYPIKPLSLGTALLPRLRNNYIKLGFGNYAMPLLEVYLSSVRNKRWNSGISVRHQSAQGDEDFNNFSDNSVHGWAKHFMSKGAVSVDGRYDRNMIMLYGFEPSIPKPSEDNLKMVYHTFDMKGLYENLVNDSNDLSVKAGMGYYNFSGKTISENDFRMHATLKKRAIGIPFELYTAYTYNITNSGVVVLPVGSVTVLNRNFFDFNPRAALVDEYFYIRAGFNSVIYSDNTNQSEVYFFPVAEAGYHIIKNKLTLFGGITGDLKRNSYRSILNENPFVTSFASKTLFPNTTNNFEMYIGLKGHLGKQTDYLLSGSIAKMQNLLFYAQDSNLYGQVTLYDESKNAATVSSMKAELNHQFSDKFRLGMTLNTYSYSLALLSDPFSRPTLEARLNSSYNLSDKFLLRADVFYMNERTGAIRSINSNGIILQPVNIGRIIDLNLGVDYRYNKSVSAFLQLNNLANNRYQRWTSYPVYGINVLGGLTFTF